MIRLTVESMGPGCECVEVSGPFIVIEPTGDPYDEPMTWTVTYGNGVQRAGLGSALAVIAEGLGINDVVAS